MIKMLTVLGKEWKQTVSILNKELENIKNPIRNEYFNS